MTSRMSTGQRGEEIAQHFLEERGLKLVERNWRCRAGELDLVMLDGDVLVYVEVKTRRNRTAGAAEESVSPSKGEKLLATGEWYLAEHPAFADHLWRIDIVAVTMTSAGRVTRITHLPNAVTAG